MIRSKDIAPLAPFALAALLAAPVAAQTLLDVGSLRAINDADVVDAQGNEIGEVEDVLVDTSGAPVAVVVEIDAGPLGISDEEVIFAFDQLTYQNGDYMTSLDSAAIEALPRYDD